VNDDGRVMASWRTGPLARPPSSDHTWLEIVHAVHFGHEPGQPPPLRPGEPVPGCGCAKCTGVPAGDPARRRRRSRPSRPIRVEDARSVPILHVCARLGLGEPVGRWGEPRVLCPLHDDHDPSLRLNLEKNAWYCDVCGQGGDAIELWKLARSASFAETVQELIHQ